MTAPETLATADELAARSALTWVRRGLLALTAIGIGGAAYELASERHWNGWQQLIPWAALGVLTVAVAIALVSLERVGSSPSARRAARALALFVLLVSIYGIWVHVHANYESGVLDGRYADTWDSMSAVSRWWYAVTKTVGPAPPLAPGMLGQSALLLLLATLGAPRGRRPIG